MLVQVCKRTDKRSIASSAPSCFAIFCMIRQVVPVLERLLGVPSTPEEDHWDAHMAPVTRAVSVREQCRHRA